MEHGYKSDIEHPPPPKWSMQTAAAGLKHYFNRHPIMCAYAVIVGSVSLCTVYNYINRDVMLDCVQKYRRYYIIYRPDDAGARLVKRKEIGLDKL